MPALNSRASCAALSWRMRVDARDQAAHAVRRRMSKRWDGFGIFSRTKPSSRAALSNSAAAPVIVENEEVDALAVADLLQMRDGRAVDVLHDDAEEDDLANDAARLHIVRTPPVDAQARKVRQGATLPQTSFGSAGFAGLSRHSREPSRPGMKTTGRRATADGVCAYATPLSNGVPRSECAEKENGFQKPKHDDRHRPAPLQRMKTGLKLFVQSSRPQGSLAAPHFLTGFAPSQVTAVFTADEIEFHVHCDRCPHSSSAPGCKARCRPCSSCRPCKRPSTI